MLFCDGLNLQVYIARRELTELVRSTFVSRSHETFAYTQVNNVPFICFLVK